MLNSRGGLFIRRLKISVASLGELHRLAASLSILMNVQPRIADSPRIDHGIP